MQPNPRSEAVSRMKAYIDLHLQQRSTARDVAEAAGCSQFHAARIFRQETGMSPFEYVREARLTAAARDLRIGQSKVLDVALDYVFDSHEGFTRAFVNGFGIRPRQFASIDPPHGWRVPIHYLNRSKAQREEMLVTRTSFIFAQVVERPARKLMLRRSRSASDYGEYVEEVGCGSAENSAPWDILVGIKEALYEPVGVWLPPGMTPPGTGTYAHGVELPSNFQGPIPAGFEVVDLEPCKYIVFQGEPYDDANYAEAVDHCMKRIDEFNPETYGFTYAPDSAPKMQLAPQGWRGYIEMRPIQ